MRLLFLSNLFPPFDLGGYEQWANEIASLLAERGHSIHVLTSDFGLDGDPPPPEDEDRVTRALRLQTDIHHYRPLDFFTRRRRNLDNNRKAVRDVVAGFRPDLILVWGMWNLDHAVARQAEDLLPGKVAYFVSSYWPEDRDPHTAYWRLPGRGGLRGRLKAVVSSIALAQLAKEPSIRLDFAHVRCCSRYVRDRLVSAGKLPEHAGVLYGGISPAPFLREPGICPREGPLRLLYFGSLIPQKGVRAAVDAVAELNRRGFGSRIRLTLLGSGHDRYEAELRAAVQRNGLENIVTFHPRVPRDNVPGVLHQHDVYLFTSVWAEPMARTVMEAMAAGLLVIGTEVGGQVEMLSNGENALTFSPGDPVALADQVESVLANPEQSTKLAAAGQKMVLERFTLDRMTDDFDAWLGSI